MFCDDTFGNPLTAGDCALVARARCTRSLTVHSPRVRRSASTGNETRSCAVSLRHSLGDTVGTIGERSRANCVPAQRSTAQPGAPHYNTRTTHPRTGHVHCPHIFRNFQVYVLYATMAGVLRITCHVYGMYTILYQIESLFHTSHHMVF